MTLSSVEVHSKIFFYLRACQMFGLCPTSLHCKGSKQSKSWSGIHNLISGCYLAFGIGVTFLLMYEKDETFLYVDNHFAAAIDLLNISVLGLGYFVMYIECLVRRKDTMYILRSLTYLSSQRETNNGTIYKRFLFISIFYFLSTVLSHLFYIMDIADDFSLSLPVSCGYITLNILCFVRMIQVIGFIEIVRAEIQNLRREALKMELQHGFQIPDDHIKSLAVSFEIIFEISDRVQKSTSWSVKVILLQIYFKLVISAYWVYWEYYKQKQITEITFILVNFFQLFIFLNTAGGFQSKKNLFLHTVCRLPNDIGDLKTAQRIFGLCPVSLHCKGSKTSKTWSGILYFVNGCYMTYGVGVIYLMICEDTETTFYATEKFGAAINTLTLSTMISGYLVMYIECLMGKEDTMYILKMLTCLENQRETNNGSNYKRFHLASIFLFLSIVLGHILYIINTTSQLETSLTYCCGFVIINVLCFVRLIQVIGFIEIERLEVEILNRKAIQMKLDYGSQIPNDHIQRLAVAYGIIYEISKTIQRSTSWSVKVILLQMYINMVINAYWVYWEFHKHIQNTEFAFVLLNFLQLFIFLNIVGAFESRKKYLLHTICRLPNDVENLKSGARINALILQIKHQNITFDANGVFPLNRKVVKTILETIATYMLFYIQFMEKLENIF